MTVTAALRAADDWYTLTGWMNHETGEIEGITPPEVSLFIAIVMMIVGAIVLSTFASHGDLTPRNVVLVAVCGAVGIGMLVDSKRAMAIQKQLRTAAG